MIIFYQLSEDWCTCTVLSCNSFDSSWHGIIYSVPLHRKDILLMTFFLWISDDQPVQFGTEELDFVHYFVYCKNISLNSTSFHDFSPILVIHSVDWNQTMIGMDTQNIHGASTSWTANVSMTGFTACVRANYHPSLLPPTSAKPTLNWLAYQENVQYRTDGALYGGTKILDSFASGSVCTNVSIKVRFRSLFEIVLPSYNAINM